MVKETPIPPVGGEASHDGLLKAALFKMARHLPNTFFRFLEMLYNPIALIKISKALRGQEYDFIYERYAYFNFAGAVAKRLFKIPLMLEVNIVTQMQDVRKMELARMARFIERKVIGSADAVFVVSAYLKEFLISEGFDSERIHVQPNAYDTDETRSTPDIPENLKQKLSGRVAIGFLGRLLPWYRLDHLMRTFEAIHEKMPKTHLILVGDGTERQSLEALVASLGLTDHVTFFGNVSHDRALSLLALMDIGVIPSTNLWGSPVKLFEYMGKSIPVVAPRIDVVTSIMRDGVHGKTFRYDDFEELQAALEFLIADPESRRRMGQNARKHILENHTWEKVGQSIISVSKLLPRGCRQ
jgi:glycosyltransferase involved in cell wall biosynthesis